MWDLKGSLLLDLDQHTAGVSSAIFSSNGQLILTNSADNTAKVWMTPDLYESWIDAMGLAPLSKAKQREYRLDVE